MTPEAVIARTFGQELAAIDDTTSSDSVEEWDSLGQINLVIELESAYGVSFSPEEAMSMTNVAAIKNVLRGHGVEW
jgi:acyl carrier protein